MLFLLQARNKAVNYLHYVPICEGATSELCLIDLILGIADSGDYQDEKNIVVAPLNDESYLRKGKFLDAQGAVNSNLVQIFVFANDDTKEALLVARLDNLGKGASGAAVQNLNIMLGLD